MNLTNLQLAPFLADCLKVQQSVAALKGVTIQTTVEDNVGIKADMDMLKLVIQNLVNNAIKFTPKGGEIRVYCTEDKGVLELYIADNGIGISEDRQDSHFSFHATSTYGTDNEKGVGLGLILCKEYTELQGGNISFSSTPGLGTIFKLEFST